jgi:hypothetical protein
LKRPVVEGPLPLKSCTTFSWATAGGKPVIDAPSNKKKSQRTIIAYHCRQMAAITKAAVLLNPVRFNLRRIPPA